MTDSPTNEDMLPEEEEFAQIEPAVGQERPGLAPLPVERLRAAFARVLQASRRESDLSRGAATTPSGEEMPPAGEAGPAQDAPLGAIERRDAPAEAMPEPDSCAGLGAERVADRLSPQALEQLRDRPVDAVASLLRAVSDQSRSARARMTVCEVGTVRQVGDGVASVWGLPQASSDELVRFRHGTVGLVMNLDLNWIDCILLGPDDQIQGGDVVWSTGQRISVPVGDRLLGRTLNALGEPTDGKGPIRAEEWRPVEREAPGIVDRQAIDEPLQTGLKAVDAIIPIGRGQRELIVGDRQTGKTTLALDTIINQRDTGVLCVYVSIGKRKSALLQNLHTLESAGAMSHTVVLAASPDDPPALVYLAPYAGCTIAEDFMLEGRDVLIVYDDLTAHADAYRELSLLLRRPPGREAYPGDIFYLHARLLERACRLTDELGGGSLTALPIVETRRGNIQGYVPTNLISITDGQIYLSPELFNQGFKPAIDVGLSVSRVGGAAQSSIMRKISSQFKLLLAQYDEVAHFARFGTEIDRTTQQQITRGLRLREALKQPVHRPLPLARQVLVLFAAGQGHLDALPLERVADYEQALWVHVQRHHRWLIGRVEEGGEWDDSFAQRLGEVVEQFSASFETER